MFAVIDVPATGKRIKALMEREGLTPVEVADIVGFTTEVGVYKWLRGDGCPRIDTLVILAQLFHTTLDDIIQTRRIDD